MSNPAAASEKELSGAVTMPTARRRSYTWLVWLAALCGVVGQLLFSNDWCLYTIPAALLAAFAFWVVVAFTTLMSRSGRPPRWQIGFVLAVLIGLGSGAIFRVIPNWAFQTALGVDRPDKVLNLRIWRHYEGGGGDHTLILEFTADDSTFHKLAGDCRPPDSYRVEHWRNQGEGWTALYQVFCGGTFGPATWEQITPISHPTLLYRSDDSSRTLLVRDESTGRTIVVHSR